MCECGGGHKCVSRCGGVEYEEMIARMRDCETARLRSYGNPGRGATKFAFSTALTGESLVLSIAKILALRVSLTRSNQGKSCVALMALWEMPASVRFSGRSCCLTGGACVRFVS